MKTNVDLTENQIFSRGNLRNQKPLILSGGGLPWNADSFQRIQINSDAELRSNSYRKKKTLIYTGNKKQRAENAKYERIYNRNYCDCCGIRINKKPWKRENGLCNRCNESLKERLESKIPW